MRKLLLFTIVISFLTIISCSKDEESTEVSLTEKEYLVKQTIIEFNKSAVKTGKYNRFVSDVSRKSTTEPLSRIELRTLLQDFLGDQTQAFLDVYYRLEALNMTDEEFRSISGQFEYLRLEMNTNLDKSDGSCCASANAGNPGSIWGSLVDFICGGCQEE